MSLRMNLKLLWWFTVNLLLLPIYMAFMSLALILAITPLNPTRLAWQNLRLRGKYSILKTYLTTVMVWMNYGLYGLEAVVFWRLGAIIETNRAEYFDFLNLVVKAYGLQESKKGFLFLGGHYCVIEQAGDSMNQFLRTHHSGEVNVLNKPARLALLTWLLEWYRKARRFNVIWTGNSERVLEQMKSGLASGNSIALVNDQKPKKGGIFVKFFDEFAGFPFRGAHLVTEHPVACVANNVRRIAPGMFRLEYALLPNQHLVVVDQKALDSIKNSFVYQPAEIWEPSKEREIHGEHLVSVMSHYVGWLQTLIELSPYQWCWDYRKWSRKPGTTAKI